MALRFVAACLAAIILLPAHTCAAAERGVLVIETASGSHEYSVEIAGTNAERAKGLMFRRFLPKNSGMIFLYDKPQVIGMWMRNTYIPLDMVFIAADGTVHRVATHTDPFSTKIVSSEGAVTAVLELNAGEAERIELKPGDCVVFEGLGAAR